MSLSQQPINHDISPESTAFVPSIVHGPSDPPLVTLTLGGLLDLQAQRYATREALVVRWTGARWTYKQLSDHSLKLARMLLDVGIRPGDRVGIMAGNCEQYVAVVFAAARAGAILTILNNTYTADEATRALRHTACKILFTTSRIGAVDNTLLLSRLLHDTEAAPMLEEVIILYGENDGFRTYDEAIQDGSLIPSNTLREVQAGLSASDICMLLFTSGSTGNPKAAGLTHNGVVNNARFIGDRMDMTAEDILTCPPPLFHCFGLVLGLLAAITHGAKVVYPGELFDAKATLEAIAEERATALHGVPAMFDTLFSLPRKGLDLTSLRTGIIAGSPVPQHLMKLMLNDFGMTQWTSSYGLTEASPTCFNATTQDSMDRKLRTVGKVMPHAHAKLVDRNGHIVPVGTRGELCMAGYQLQAGYWSNPEKTAECMELDEEGVLWLHTGDEAVFDHDGYCSITGRFKDIIIRGGENIYPLEIEDRLVEHPAIERAIVTGISHTRLVEVVGAFLQRKPGHEMPSDDELRSWTRQSLGRHKSPQHVFWLGEDGMTSEIPLTGSGKIQKFMLRDIGEQWLASREADATRPRL